MNDIAYMQRALQLAEKGRFTVSPNPMVGCVIVKDNKIVGEGFHDKAGNPHAEIYALQSAGAQAKGATVYLTLEPCCHTGKTPPCTKALIAHGVKKVVIPMLDPNPLVSGKGIKELKDAGIEVEVGLEADRANQLNEVFNYYITHQRPFVILKWAMSLDGKAITPDTDSKRISGIETQYHAHQLRREVDAVLVGSNTAIRDNPQLTARLDPQEQDLKKQPLRIILTNKTLLPENLNVFNKAIPGNTLVVTTDPAFQAAYQKQSIEVLYLPPSNHGKVDVPALLNELGDRGITSLLVEGGMTVQHAFLKADAVNKIHMYLASVLIGTLDKKRPVNDLISEKMGNDYHFTAYLKR